MSSSKMVQCQNADEVTEWLGEKIQPGAVILVEEGYARTRKKANGAPIPSILEMVTGGRIKPLAPVPPASPKAPTKAAVAAASPGVAEILGEEPAPSKGKAKG